MSITPSDVNHVEPQHNGQKDCQFDEPLIGWRQVRMKWGRQFKGFLFSVIAMTLLCAEPSRAETNTLDGLLSERVELTEELIKHVTEYQEHAKAFRDARTKTTVNTIELYLKTGALLVDLAKNKSKKGGNAEDYSNLLQTTVDAFKATGVGLMAAIESQRAYPKAVASLEAIKATVDRMTQIDLQVAAGIYRGAEERGYLAPEQFEVPCPPGAVPLAPIGEEGKCYEDRMPERGPYGTPYEEMMPEDGAYEMLDFCAANPDALFCQVGTSPGRFGAYCEGPNPAKDCIATSTAPARIGGYCEGDNPAPDCLPTNP